jgi:hypothetical protein
MIASPFSVEKSPVSKLRFVNIFINQKQTNEGCANSTTGNKEARPGKTIFGVTNLHLITAIIHSLKSAYRMAYFSIIKFCEVIFTYLTNPFVLSLK